jgi:histidinol-phosphate aminotransferase
MFKNKDIRFIEKYTNSRTYSSKSIFLDSNESYKQWVELDATEFSKLNRYPDIDSRELRSRLSRDYSLSNYKIENIFISSGSIELIELVLKGNISRKSSIMIIEPCYSVYEIQAQIFNIRVKRVLRNEDFSLPVKKIREGIHDVNLLVICSPDNPTGVLLRKQELDEILQFYQGIIVIDEAYIEFAGLENSFEDYCLRYPNILVFRTFSKAWGLAGIRLGYAIGSKQIIELLEKIRNPYNVSYISQIIGIQALEQKDKLPKYLKDSENNKVNLIKMLIQAKFDVRNTKANFILLSLNRIANYIDDLVRRNIFIRNRDQMPLMTGIARVTVGAEEENMMLVDQLINLKSKYG